MEPKIYRASQLASLSKNQTQIRDYDGQEIWIPMRPMQIQSIFPDIIWKFQCAWKAFTGECDLIDWSH